MADRLKTLSTRIELEDGTRQVLRQGDEVPSNISSGSRKRLESLGAIGEPETPGAPSEPSDLVAADHGSLVEFVDNAKADQVVEAAGDDAQLAQRLLDAETEAQGGEPRKTVESGLTKVIEG